jgi:hypothetical protein
METNMRGVLFTAVSLLLWGGCEDEKLAGLQGRWEGTIICYEGESDITVGLDVYGSKIEGTAHIRSRDNNTTWSVAGASTQSCKEDTCRSSKECPSEDGEPRRCGPPPGSSPESYYNPACVEQVKNNPECQKQGANCDPCQYCHDCMLCASCNSNWLPLKITLQDDNAILPDPWLKMWRYSEWTMVGTIAKFCANDEAMKPEVELRKQ